MTVDVGDHAAVAALVERLLKMFDKIDVLVNFSMQPRLSDGGGERGWIGDSPFIFLDCQKFRSLGWRPGLAIRDAVIRTLDYLCANRWLLEARSLAP